MNTFASAVFFVIFVLSCRKAALEIRFLSFLFSCVDPNSFLFLRPYCLFCFDVSFNHYDVFVISTIAAVVDKSSVLNAHQRIRQFQNLASKEKFVFVMRAMTQSILQGTGFLLYL